MFDPEFDPFMVRGILTETLPFELPLIFSNEKLYSNLSGEFSTEVKVCLEKIFQPYRNYTKPYNFSIKKGQDGTTALSVIHPKHQIRIAQFYCKYGDIMIHHCKRSKISLRYPASIASPYALDVVATQTPKTGLVEESNEGADLLPKKELGHLSSYFVYRGYNLLGRFRDSKKFISYEKRFSLLRTLDVSKCFFNIYTHSLTWAVKGKEFSKAYSSFFSFEGEFDKLMQKANYNETNGIVVGPEVSRIFAEIILQEVDNRVHNRLFDEGHVFDRDYVIRRYIDDFFIFANREELLDKISKVISEELEFFKLFPNRSKEHTYIRPFVSNITLARDELSLAFAPLWKIESIEDMESIDLRDAIKRTRLTLSRNAADASTISSFILAALLKSIRKIKAVLKGGDVDAPTGDKVCKLIVHCLDLTYYVCAMDLRVRTTYTLSQILENVMRISELIDVDHSDTIKHIIHEETSSLIQVCHSKNSGDHSSGKDSIELCNLLILGSHTLGSDFLCDQHVSKVMHEMLSKPLTYFRYITLKFLYLKDVVAFRHELTKINHQVLEKIGTFNRDLDGDTESFLIYCDHFSSPDLSDRQRREVFGSVFPGSPSNVTLRELSRILGFVDWKGVRISHLLKRKQLRPVYE